MLEWVLRKFVQTEKAAKGSLCENFRYRVSRFILKLRGGYNRTLPGEKTDPCPCLKREIPLPERHSVKADVKSVNGNTSNNLIKCKL